MRRLFFVFAGACSTGAVLPPVARGPVSSQGAGVHLSRAAVLQAWVQGLDGNCTGAEEHLATAALVGEAPEEIRGISSRIAEACGAVQGGESGPQPGVEP